MLATNAGDLDLIEIQINYLHMQLSIFIAMNEILIPSHIYQLSNRNLRWKIDQPLMAQIRYIF